MRVFNFDKLKIMPKTRIEITFKKIFPRLLLKKELASPKIEKSNKDVISKPLGIENKIIKKRDAKIKTVIINKSRIPFLLN